eukprot:8851723-Pyramimonas_sp.AAC.1
MHLIAPPSHGVDLNERQLRHYRPPNNNGLILLSIRLVTISHLPREPSTAGGSIPVGEPTLMPPSAAASTSTAGSSTIHYHYRSLSRRGADADAGL